MPHLPLPDLRGQIWRRAIGWRINFDALSGETTPYTYFAAKINCKFTAAASDFRLNWKLRASLYPVTKQYLKLHLSPSSSSRRFLSNFARKNDSISPIKFLSRNNIDIVFFNPKQQCIPWQRSFVNSLLYFHYYTWVCIKINWHSNFMQGFHQKRKSSWYFNVYL